jgi:hypothetical protein
MREEADVLGFRPRREWQPPHLRLRIWAKRLIVAVTLLLLMSMGGATVAAPFLVPALWWAYRSSGKWARTGLALLGGLVMAEVGWLLAYSIAGERQPFILAIPSLCFVGTMVLFGLRGRASTVPDDGPREHSEIEWSIVDVGAGLAFLLAASMTAATVGLVFFDDKGFTWVWSALYLAGSAAAWMGFWAWSREHWLAAAGAFGLSLAWPGGFATVATYITVALTVSFVVISLVRAWRGRLARRARLPRSDRSH